MEIVELEIHYQYEIDVFKQNKYNVTLKSEVEKCYLEMPTSEYKQICNCNGLTKLTFEAIQQVPIVAATLGCNEEVPKKIYNSKINLDITHFKILSHTVLGYKTLKANLENGENKDKSSV